MTITSFKKATQTFLAFWEGHQRNLLYVLITWYLCPSFDPSLDPKVHPSSHRGHIQELFQLTCRFFPGAYT